MLISGFMVESLLIIVVDTDEELVADEGRELASEEGL